MADETKTGTENQEQENKTYSEAEIQSMIDKRVTEALNTQKKKLDKQKEEAVEEAKKMAAMDEAQKKEYELSLKQKELDEKIKELNYEKSKNEASKLLTDKKLSLELLEFVVSDDSNIMKQNVDKLAAVFGKAVNSAAEERLNSSTPKRGNDTPSVTHEQFKKMTQKEKQELYTQNPELYMQVRNNK